MKKRYSVIIPVYNGEKTLGRCLDSLLRQNRTDVQILVISDGSDDHTDAIAESYGSQICFHRQPHLGVAAARNAGIALAKGESITFLDCDDWVSPDYFAVLDREPDCDLLLFGLSETLRRRCRRKDPVAVLLRSGNLTSCCNKRISRRLLETSGVRFPEGQQVGEDFLFSFRLALAADRIHLAGDCIYQVDITNQKSLSRGYRPHLAEDLCRVYAEAAQSGRYLDVLDYLSARAALTCLAELWKAGRPKKAQIRDICRRFAKPLGSCRGLRHSFLRLCLARQWWQILAMGAWVGKGWRYSWQRRKSCW